MSCSPDWGLPKGLRSKTISRAERRPVVGVQPDIHPVIGLVIRRYHHMGRAYQVTWFELVINEFTGGAMHAEKADVSPIQRRLPIRDIVYCPLAETGRSSDLG